VGGHWFPYANPAMATFHHPELFRKIETERKIKIRNTSFLKKNLFSAFRVTDRIQTYLMGKNRFGCQ
jgi:hypothetical protein